MPGFSVLAYLSEFSDVVQLVDLRAQRVEDGHVVGVLQQLLLQVLEHSQRVAEQDLKIRQDKIGFKEPLLWCVGRLTMRKPDSYLAKSAFELIFCLCL